MLLHITIMSTQAEIPFASTLEKANPIDKREGIGLWISIMAIWMLIVSITVKFAL